MQEEVQVMATDVAELMMIAALARGDSVTTAAAAARVSVRTVYRRLAVPEFRAKVVAFRRKMFASISGRMLELVTRATDILQGVMRDAEPELKLKAASKVIDFAFKSHAIDVRDRRTSGPGPDGDPLQAIHELELDLCREDVVPDPPLFRLEADGTIAAMRDVRTALDPSSLPR